MPIPTERESDAFQWIPTQTSSEDRRALLSLQDAVIECIGEYVYLEVGSHFGGSLQPHVGEPRCKTIYSIDPRPEEQPDQHILGTYKYEGNSTKRMIEYLQRVPGADLRKLITFDSCSWDLKDDGIPCSVNFAFVDGEHTNRAVHRDYEAVRRFLAPRAVLAFHDFYVTPRTLLRIRRGVLAESPGATFLHYPSSNIVCIAIDRSSALAKVLEADGWNSGEPAYRMQSFRLKWICRWNEFRSALKSRYPRFATVATKVKRKCLKQSKAS